MRSLYTDGITVQRSPLQTPTAVDPALPITTPSSPEVDASSPSHSPSTTDESQSEDELPEPLGDIQDFRCASPLDTYAMPGPSAYRIKTCSILKRKREAEDEADKENLPVDDDLHSEDSDDDEYTPSSPLPSRPQKRVKAVTDDESEVEEEEEVE